MDVIESTERQKMQPVFLTIAHNLFPNREERYRLREPNTEVDTVGICLPVWVSGVVTSEPAEEIYCRYRLRNYTTAGTESVHTTDDGYTISLGDKTLWDSILDSKDGGSGSIYLTHQGKLVKNEIEMLVIHYINIQDIGVLIKEKNGFR